MNKIDVTRDGRPKLLLHALAALLITLAPWAGTVCAQTGPVDRLAVRVTDAGFALQQMNVTPGKVPLTLENRAAAAITIRIGREGGALIREVQVQPGASLNTDLDTTPGVYTLTEPDHGWVFRLVVRGAGGTQ